MHRKKFKKTGQSFQIDFLKLSTNNRLQQTKRILIITVMFSMVLFIKGFSAIIEDKYHRSIIMGEIRNYRVFLPPDYYSSDRRYPVIYWYHGSGGSSKQNTYLVDFEDYLNTNDLIIVNVDGTTPSGSTWDYGLAFEYNTRTQEGKVALTGRYFSKYIRELIGVIDSQYRTIADRDHRAVSGQSMGGLMSPWIASQNKDLFGSVSMFSPSPDAAMFGPAGKEVCFTNRELYRSLKGMPVRITVARGDRYRQYYFEQKAIWDLADLTFEFHEADYPDHKAVDIPAQFDFHMAEFNKSHLYPKNWDHADPFPDFKVWNYEVDVSRKNAAFTILEKVTPAGMLICSRSYLPNGPIIEDDEIRIITDSIYNPLDYYTISDYNRSSGDIRSFRLQSDNRGRLSISVGPGGHCLGINGSSGKPKLFLIPEYDREEIYSEDGHEYSLSFTIVNMGTTETGPIQIKTKTSESYLQLNNDTFTLKSLGPLSKANLKDLIRYKISNYNFEGMDCESFVTKLSLEVICNDTVQDIQKIFIYPVPKTPILTDMSDLLILDGASRYVEIYNNQTHEISVQKVSGGTGNGNGIIEPGETIELYVRLSQGLGLHDLNTYHPAFLLNIYESPLITVPELRFNIKGVEWSGAPNLQSKIKISQATPEGEKINLWLKCESYEFCDEGYARDIQRHIFDYSLVTVTISGEK